MFIAEQSMNIARLGYLPKYDRVNPLDTPELAH